MEKIKKEIETKKHESKNDFLEGIFFPHDRVRKVQDSLISDVKKCIDEKNHLIAHAPTGLGKTAATLAPSLAYAVKNDKTIFFLTSRHTQHLIAIETLKKIKEKYNLDFCATSIIGKRWMCSQAGIEHLSSSDFADFCKTLKEDGQCEFHEMTRTKQMQPTVKCQKILSELAKISPCSTEQIIEHCSKEKLCPYEVSIMLAARSSVIISDYYYIFDPGVSATFLAKSGKSIGESIIIIDEGHNLPARMRNLLTIKLSTYVVRRAIKEAKKNNFDEILLNIVGIQDIINSFAEGMEKDAERLVTKESFMQEINKIKDYQELAKDMEFAAEEIRKNKKRSFVGSVARFLELWPGEDKGFSRIFSIGEIRGEPSSILSNRCLDPSMITREIINTAHSTILMSGTLTPTAMYKDLLGFPEKTVESVYESPFPQDNRLNLIIPRTTTKFTMRNEQQYKNIAAICAEIVNNVPGNSAIFFPSYYLRDQVDNFFSTLSRKTIFLENPKNTKQERQDLLDKFVGYQKTGAVLLGVTSGSFGEGIDLPGNALKCVVIVGLPLDRPDLETKELIKYYDDKFGKGWDYGYILPALTRTLQNAGRCIRSETDKGVIVFLDERYTWPNYFRCFPSDWKLRISADFVPLIDDFFKTTSI